MARMTSSLHSRTAPPNQRHDSALHAPAMHMRHQSTSCAQLERAQWATCSSAPQQFDLQCFAARARCRHS